MVLLMVTGLPFRCVSAQLILTRIVAATHDHRLGLFARRLRHQNKTAVGIEIIKDHLHHLFVQLLLVGDGSDEIHQLINDAQLKLGRLPRVGRTHDHRIVVGRDSVFDVDVHLPLARQPHRRELLLFDTRVVAEDQQRVARADLIAGMQQPGLADPDPVDKGAVGRAQVAEVPPCRCRGSSRRDGGKSSGRSAVVLRRIARSAAARGRADQIADPCPGPWMTVRMSMG